MDLNQTASCFVCIRDVLDKDVLLSKENTTHSKTPILTKLMQLLGDDFMLVILEDDKICHQCVSLINQTDKLEQDLRKSQSIIRGFLNEKYNLNEETKSSYLELQGKEDHMSNGESLLDSKNVKQSYEEGHFPSKVLRETKELTGKSENACNVKIKSEPVLKSDQDFNNEPLDTENSGNKISPVLLKKLPEDKKDVSNLDASWSDANKVLQDSQDLAVLKLKQEQDSFDCEEINDKNPSINASNHTCNINENSKPPVLVPSNGHSFLDKGKLEFEIVCDHLNSAKEIKAILSPNSIHSAQITKGNSAKAELVTIGADGELSGEVKRNPSSSHLNKQKNQKRSKKPKQENTVRKLRPILPKVSNFQDVLSSLYIIQHPDTSVDDEILNQQAKYNLTIKSENLDVGNSKDKEPTIKNAESNLNCCVLNESEQLNLVTYSSLTDNSNLHCKVCNNYFIDVETFKSHKKVHSQNRYKCGFCSKSFKRKASVKTHEVLHTGNYAHYCEFCGVGCATAHKLEQHRRRHTKEESYMCDVCGKKFHFQGTYWIHRKWHDNPFPYKCDDCGKPFKHSSRLSVHRRKHRGERPYKCLYCPLTFDVSQTLKRHLVLHTKQFPFKCVICDQGFTTRSKYSDHMAKKHDTSVEKPSVDPKDFKVAVHSTGKEKSGLDLASVVETIDLGENNFHIENPELIFQNPEDCQIEIILPPSSVISDNSFSNISWLT